MKQIITKIRICYFLPEYEDEIYEAVIDDATNVFVEILKPIIPLDKLNDAYLRAVSDNRSGFPISASSIITAYSVILEENYKPKYLPCKFCQFEAEFPERPCFAHSKNKVSRK